MIIAQLSKLSLTEKILAIPLALFGLYVFLLFTVLKYIIIGLGYMGGVTFTVAYFMFMRPRKNEKI